MNVHRCNSVHDTLILPQLLLKLSVAELPHGRVVIIDRWDQYDLIQFLHTYPRPSCGNDQVFGIRAQGVVGRALRERHGA